MKSKFLLSLLLGSALGLSAQGFKDGVEYYRADQPEEALIILTNTLNQAGTEQATSYYYLGQIAMQKGDKAAAKANFEKGLAADPNNGYNYIGMGALALADGNLGQAKDYFKDAKGKAKKDPDVLTEIARAYFIADPVKYATEIDKALADAKKAKKNAPSPFILEGDRLAPTNVGDAAGMYEMAAQFDTANEHPEAYVKYARTYFRVNPQYAIQKLKDLLAQQPNSALAQRELAEKYYDNNQLTLAAQQYEQYIQNPNHFKKDKQRLVGLLFFAQRYPESYALAGEILKEEPANFYMQRMQFYNKKAMGEKEAAKAAAETLMSNPKADLNSQDYTQYGELLQDMGDDSTAVLMYEKAVGASPEKASLLKDLSSAYNQAHMFDKAAEAMERYMAASGDDNLNDQLQLALRWNAVAASKMETDSVASQAASQKAIAAIEKVKAEINDNPIVLNNYARILMTANRNVYDQAVYDADMATLACLDADPSNLEKRKSMYTQVLGRLGNYEISTLKDTDKARATFTRFYEISPSEELKAYIETLAPAEAK
ncbi:MAG: hypothetical protein NC210_03550 [[Clostridium] fimetarium]|nr:hypothetical protein [Alistipes timonensis]MCM1405478.1 hypothetical protein [[Clostridium] fimetarium]